MHSHAAALLSEIGVCLYAQRQACVSRKAGPLRSPCGRKGSCGISASENAKSSGVVEAIGIAMITAERGEEAVEERQVYDSRKYTSVVCPRLESKRPGLFSLVITTRSVPEKIETMARWAWGLCERPFHPYKRPRNISAGNDW